jgi:type IV secretory pathway VirB4 component
VVLNKQRGIYIPSDALNYGTTVFGTTGGGKTNTLKLYIEFAINNRENILFINGKEDFDLYEDLKILCENNGYDLKV